jgi:hypothetical protein
VAGQAGRRPAGRQRAQAREQLLAVAADDDGLLIEPGAGGDQRVPDHGRGELGVGHGVVVQPHGLIPQRRLGLRGDDPRHDRRVLRVLRRRLLGRGRRLQDDVGVGAADAERGDGGPARPVGGGGPVGRLGQQPHRAGVPVDVRAGLLGVEGLRQAAVPHRHDHLDDPGGPGGGLGVPDVRLDGAEPQRLLPLLPVHLQQRLRLDRVAERGAGAVRLDGVDVRR